MTEAKVLLLQASKGPYQPVAANVHGQWYDIRGYSEADREQFIKDVGSDQMVEIDTQEIITKGGQPKIKGWKKYG